MLPIENKVALVTGGGAEIGFYSLKELFKSGLRGATIADDDRERGEKALKEIIQEFGPNKAIFVKTDISVRSEVEAAFKKTIAVFKNIDIVINNAAVGDDSIWEKEIAVNVNGAIHLCFLALEYLPKYRSGNEGVIVNVCSVAALVGMGSMPVYATTRHAQIGLFKSLSTKLHYDRSKVKVITICPGGTNISLYNDCNENCCYEGCESFFQIEKSGMTVQEPDVVVKAIIQVITTAANGSFWLVDNGKIQNLPHLQNDPEPSK